MWITRLIWSLTNAAQWGRPHSNPYSQLNPNTSTFQRNPTYRVTHFFRLSIYIYIYNYDSLRYVIFRTFNHLILNFVFIWIKDRMKKKPEVFDILKHQGKSHTSNYISNFLIEFNICCNPFFPDSPNKVECGPIIVRVTV